MMQSCGRRAMAKNEIAGRQLLRRERKLYRFCTRAEWGWTMGSSDGGVFEFSVRVDGLLVGC